MIPFLAILTAIVALILVIVAAMRPIRSPLSDFELGRLAGHGHKESKDMLRRESLLGDVASILTLATSILLVLMTVLSVLAFGWFLGIVVAIIVVLFYGAAARLTLIHSNANRLYEMIEPALLRFIEKTPVVFAVVRTLPLSANDRYPRVDSRQELQHLIESSGDVLSDQEKKLVVHGLSFGEHQVKSVMTPKSMIDSIKKTEFLGPLVLSELHDLGHSRLPVIDGDIDHVVGVLHIRDLLSLDKRQSVTAEKAMEPRVLYIHEDDSLQHALAAFLRTHHHLFIVVNEYRETVGLLTLEDVIEKLLGRKIIDEDDNHDDLRAVALTNPRGNNDPATHQDV